MPSNKTHQIVRDFRKALGQGCSVDLYDLDGVVYVVTSGTGERCDFAYLAEDLLDEDFADPNWDYSEWCNSSTPHSDKRTAVAYYLETGRVLGEPGTCRRVLSDQQTDLLDIVLDLGRHNNCAPSA